MAACSKCKRETKYECIRCKRKICSVCSVPEEDDTLPGWVVGKAVGYCSICMYRKEVGSSDESDGDDIDIKGNCDKDPSESEKPPTKRVKLNPGIDDFYLKEIEQGDGDDATAKPQCKESSHKQKVGRRGKWSSDNLDDFIDIIVNNDNYVEKLIFKNTKYQQNGIIYENILHELKRRSYARGENVVFTVSQLRNKFKKCVGDCKRVALTIKTATGVKKFQTEKGYGAWFDQLFALIKTRDSCNPEKATEPSANNKVKQLADGGDGDDDADSDIPGKVYVPVRSKKKDKQKNQEKTLSEVISVVKNMVDKDPMKDLVNLVREEMKQSRDHELQLGQLMFNSSAGNFQAPMRIPELPHFFQQNSYYQSNGLPNSFLNGMNQPTVSMPETSPDEQNCYAEAYYQGSSSKSNSDSQCLKNYHSL